MHNMYVCSNHVTGHHPPCVYVYPGFFLGRPCSWRPQADLCPFGLLQQKHPRDSASADTHLGSLTATFACSRVHGRAPHLARREGTGASANIGCRRSLYRKSAGRMLTLHFPSNPGRTGWRIPLTPRPEHGGGGKCHDPPYRSQHRKHSEKFVPLVP